MIIHVFLLGCNRKFRHVSSKALPFENETVELPFADEGTVQGARAQRNPCASCASAVIELCGNPWSCRQVRMVYS
jgi:hypothetical protein